MDGPKPPIAGVGPLQPSWQTDFGVLIGCGLVLIVASVLSVNDAGNTSLGGAHGRSMPGMCMSKRVTGMDCPGCGLTRSMVAMGNGQFALAWKMHRVGPLVYLLVLIQIPLRAYALLRGVPCPWRIEAWRNGLVVWVTFGLLFVNWFYAIHTGEVWR